MSKCPNWQVEELKLALELYLSHDLQWLAKMKDDTTEVIVLSEILNGMDLIPEPRGNKFRSAGSIRMKLTNFKALDERYGKTALPNLGQLDKDVWKLFFNRYDELKQDCKEIITKQYKGAYTPRIMKYFAHLGIESVSEDDFKVFCEVMSKKANTFVSVFKNMEDDRIIKCCCKILDAISEYKNGYEAEADKTKGYIEHGGINQLPVKTDEQKVGELVQNSITSLLNQKEITKQDIECFVSEEWSRNTFHIGHPFFLEIDSTFPINQQIKDKNGYIRYWKKIHTIYGRQYVICKEWYETNRKYFLSWINNVKQGRRINVTEKKLVEILTYIKKIDEKDLYIGRDMLENKFPNITEMQIIIEFLLEKGVIAKFQGSSREYTMDDYEIFYDMVSYPLNYIL